MICRSVWRVGEYWYEVPNMNPIQMNTISTICSSETLQLLASSRVQVMPDARKFSGGAPNVLTIDVPFGDFLIWKIEAAIVR